MLEFSIHACEAFPVWDGARCGRDGDRPQAGVGVGGGSMCVPRPRPHRHEGQAYCENDPASFQIEKGCSSSFN